MHLIGINGFKRSGKGAAAASVDQLRLGVKQVGFADKLKILAAKTLGYLDHTDDACIALMDEYKESALLDLYVDADTEDEYHVNSLTVRAYLQNLGNEARQIFGDTFWIDQVLPVPSDDYSAPITQTLTGKEYRPVINAANMEKIHGDADYLCITDLRYPNEAERVKALGGTVWEILRDDTASDGHASEQPLPRELVDYEITNNGSLDQLSWNVERVMEHMGC